MGSQFDLTPINEFQTAKNSVIYSNLKDRLQSVLHNTIALRFFNQFCFQQYCVENLLFWIEVEVFKTIEDLETQKLFAKHIYLNYILPESPLRLNIDAEIRVAVLDFYDKEPKPNMFDGVQGFIDIIIKNHAYDRFENSEMFQTFLDAKKEGI